MKILLTGANGFVGTTVQRHIRCESLAVEGGLVDIRNKDEVRRAIATIVPDAVIHLAAQSFVPKSFENPAETFDINFLGTFNLLQALNQYGFCGKFLYISSADVYGAVSEDKLPIREDTELRPRSPYAVSKIAAEALCIQWSQTDRMQVVIARPFNHIGPGQDARFVVSSLAKQIVAAKRKRERAVFHVGDLDVTRDFTDVEDVVRAYLSLLSYGETGTVYNICSSVERSIRSVLSDLLEIAGVKADILLDRSRLRVSEQKRLVGQFDRLRKLTGWQPEISFRESLQSVLAYWESRAVSTNAP